MKSSDALEHGTTAIAKIDKLPAETREHVVATIACGEAAGCVEESGEI